MNRKARLAFAPGQSRDKLSPPPANNLGATPVPSRGRANYRFMVSGGGPLFRKCLGRGGKSSPTHLEIAQGSCDLLGALNGQPNRPSLRE
jgi:hypothetical protein